MGLDLPSRASWLADNIVVHERALRAWLGKRPVSGLEVDDIVQESYAILARLERTDHIRNPQAYFFSTARSVILAHLRRAKVVSIDAVEELDRLGLPFDGTSPEQQTSDRQELRRLAQTLEQLPDKCRQAFILRKVEGLSHRQIAQHMDISPSTVEKHIASALSRIMRLYGDEDRAGVPARASKSAKGSISAHGASRDS
jgi:RNA polymerase sigma factor (sigma-70 family)